MTGRGGARLSRLLVAVLVGVLLGLGCLSNDPEVQTGYDDFGGLIVEVVLTDPSEAVMVLESGGRTLPVHADLQTRILVSGAAIPLEELPRHRGCQARVICQARGGQRGDTWVIEIQPGPRRKHGRSG